MTADRSRHARPELEALRALPDERLEPVDHLAAGRARGRDERGLAVAAAYARSTTVWPGARLDEQLVAHGRRVHDQVAARRRPAASRRAARERRACRRGSAGASVRAAPPAPIRQARVASMPARISRSVLKPEHAAVAEDERVHGVARRPRRTRRRPPACAGSSRSRRRSRASGARRPPRAGPRRRTPRSASRARPPRTRRSASAARASARPGGRAARRATSSVPVGARYCSNAAALAVKKWCTWSGLRTK